MSITPGSSGRPVSRRVRIAGAASGTTSSWAVPEETAVAIVYNGVNHAVMLATPADIEDFVAGFSLTEGVVDRVDEIRAIAVDSRPQGIDVRVTIGDDAFRRFQLQARRRTLAGRSGCGLCGLDNVETLFTPLQPVSDTPASLYPGAVERAVAAFSESQPLNRETRTVHGAAWCTDAGEIQLVREDVGRHNALDKLLGALARSSADMADGFILMSSRCSYELVDKAARMKVRALVTLSAPTGLALDKAREAKLTLGCWSPEGLVLPRAD